MVVGMKRIKQLERWNDKMAKRYDIEEYYKNPILGCIENIRINEIIRIISPRKNDEILDIGCGAGHIIEEIEAGNITAIDISKEMLSKAKKRLRKKRVTFLKRDAQNIRLRKKFDKIICSEVIEHIPNPKKLIDEILKLSKESTIIVFTIPNENLIDLLKNILKLFRINRIYQISSDEWHLHRFDLEMLEKLLKDRMEIFKVSKIPLTLFPLRYVVGCRIYERK